MPESQTIERARRDKREGKSPSTQAGEFVREEFHHIREGKHGARSSKQAIAIGLSKARRAGVNLSAPRTGSAKIQRQAKRDSARGQSKAVQSPAPKRSRATLTALQHEGRNAGSHRAISRQVHRSAMNRSGAARSASAQKAAAPRKAKP